MTFLSKTSTLKHDLNPLLKLAIPLALTGLIQSSTFFFETLFLAHLSTDALAAGALVSWFYATFAVILIGSLGSINILVAHQYGAKDHQKIAYLFRDGLLLATLFTLPSVFLVWNMSDLFVIFGQKKSVATLANAYLHALAWGIFPNFLYIACLEFIMGIGHGKTIMVFSILSVLLTIFFSFCLIFGKLGMPALGIAGAGWGLSISCWITFFALIVYIFINSNYRYYLRNSCRFQKPYYLLELLQIGIPIGLMYCVEVAFLFTLTLLMGSFSSDYLASNQIVMQY